MRKTRRRKPKKRRSPWALLFAVTVGSGCSLLASKDDASEGQQVGFSQNVATNKNELALPVEVNHDIGRILSGGQGARSFQSSSGGKVNVNVNVNFNGGGWTKAVTETNALGQVTGEHQETHAWPAEAPPEVIAQISRAAGASSGRVPATSSVGAGGGRTETYVVKPGDTLMKISFEKYGSVYRWREILNSNRSKIADYNSLPPGLSLRIEGVDYVVISRNGRPYLIRLHDTLGRISRKVYGTTSFWRELWRNNPQLIHNPHRIYAGFTLYYRDKSELGQPVEMAKAGTGLPVKRKPATSRKK